MFIRREDMEAIPKIRRPTSVHTLDQVVAQAVRLGWTVGVRRGKKGHNKGAVASNTNHVSSVSLHSISA
jgi:hypothetical protein